MANEWESAEEVPQRFQEMAAREQRADERAQRFGQVNANGFEILATVTEDDILEAMRDVIDPELGINIVDLGLVYGVEFLEGGVVRLDMTLTSAACPLTDMIEEQTRMVLRDMVSEVQINWVWLPPWDPDKITTEGREQLQALGFNI